VNLHVSFTDRKLRLLSRHWQILFLFWLRSHDVDRGGGEIRLDVRRVILLDHLDGSPAPRRAQRVSRCGSGATDRAHSIAKVSARGNSRVPCMGGKRGAMIP